MIELIRHPNCRLRRQQDNLETIFRVKLTISHHKYCQLHRQQKEIEMILRRIQQR